MLRRLRPSPATVIASLALFVSLGGTSMAATGYRITSLFQIAPKVRHELRGQTGPQGPAGPQGPQGATGSQGAPQNLVVTEITGDVVTLGPNTGATAEANCPTGLIPITGGFTGTEGLNYSESRARLGGWYATAFNPTDKTEQFQAVATCVAGSYAPIAWPLPS